ncbi:MAG: hypothetical protein R3B72_49585 [Polyangiaceae bacterium]
MTTRRKYRKRQEQTVVAVKLDLEMEPLVYHKWGARQTCEGGDWLVDNDGDVYTIDADSFAKTYVEQSRGMYKKVGVVWAEQADEQGAIPTKEGSTSYEAGDYLVFNEPDGTDGYAVASAKFDKMYEPVNDEG